MTRIAPDDSWTELALPTQAQPMSFQDAEDAMQGLDTEVCFKIPLVRASF